ncbi:McrB family protein [Halomarina salina]|uniref:McrB family protein n=1 Tax=Halomarina salina TaxID=1872699 RepID=UPI0036D2FB00
MLNRVPVEATDAQLSQTPSDTIGVWGVTGGASDIWNGVNPGDYVLFYFGEQEYRYVAEVVGTHRDSDLPDELWDDATLSVTGEAVEKPFECLIYLTELREVSIESSEVHDFAGHDRKYPQNFVPLNDTGAKAIEEQYGSIEAYLESRRVNPTVWIEKTEQKNRPYKQAGGEFELGTALVSPSQDKAGRRRYDTMQEASAGDIVLHLLKEQRHIVGISTVSSGVIRNFESPTAKQWNEAQREAGGFLRKLENYEELDDQVGIYDNVLDNPTHEPHLQQIYDTNSGLFYDKNFEIAQGGYLTKAPDELVSIFCVESDDLPTKLRDRGYNRNTPVPVTEYERVSEAEEDIANRLATLPAQDNWLAPAIADAIVADWTEMLSGVEPGVELTLAEEVKSNQLLEVYREYESRLQKQARAIGSGGLNKLDPAQTLFIVFVRQLQERTGVTTNLNQVKFGVLAGGKYTVRPAPSTSGEDPPESDPLADEPAPEDAEEIRRQVEQTGQVVFYGPPGTGKTYTARRFARWWLNDVSEDPREDQLRTVTFHPSFSYEDFIEGLSASETDAGTVRYDIEPGVFKQLAEDARNAYQEHDDGEAPPYVLIIDEINRGDLAQIFGETITGLEMDKRLDGTSETPISLAHSSTQFTIPPNLYVIGTMNTADRSVALLDAALRRRFRFIAFPPDYDVLLDTYEFDSWEALRRTATSSGDETARLRSLSILAIKHLNEQILDSPDLGRGKQIGHSYLLGLKNTIDVVDAWRYEILPLLEEYLFGQFGRIREELFNGGGDRLFDWEGEQIRSFDAVALRMALAAVLDLDLTVTATDGDGVASARNDSNAGTLDILYDNGLISEGTELVFRDGYISSTPQVAYDSEESFWRCRLTGSRSRSESVRWCHDESHEPTSLSSLAKHIHEEATGERRENLNGIDVWGHPEFDNTAIYRLAKDIEDESQTES